MVRCGACGRPPQSEIDAGREVLLPGEPVDGGCFAEFRTEEARLKALMIPEQMIKDGAGKVVQVIAAHRAHSDKEAEDMALELAKGKHSERERAAFDARAQLFLERNAAGLHGATGLPLATMTLIDAGGLPVLDGQGRRQLVPITAAVLNQVKADAQVRLDARNRAKDANAETPGQKMSREIKEAGL